jgi:hypothetical protein
LAHEQLDDPWSLCENLLGPLGRPVEAEPQQLRLWCAVADMGTSGFLFFGLKASMKKRWSHISALKPGTSTKVAATLMEGRPQSNAVLLRMTVRSALSSKRVSIVVFFVLPSPASTCMGMRH